MSSQQIGLGIGMRTASARGDSRKSARKARLVAPRTLLFASFAAVLVWQVIARSVASYLAPFAPEAALMFNGHQPTALMNIATAEFGALMLSDKPLSPRHHAEINERIGALAETALRGDPLDARALRILAQVADDHGNVQRATQLMSFAAQHSLAESTAAAWIVQKSLEKEDYPRALYYADVLLRTRPQLATYLVPLLAHLAETKTASGDLKKLLRTNPPWRGYFFAALPSSVSDARTPLNLLLSVRDTPNPPTSSDLRPYLIMLLSRKLYDLAYYTRLQFLPPEELSKAGFLFNGNFALTPSGLPFDWAITPGSGVTVEMVRIPGEGPGRALLIDFQYGRVEYYSIQQTLLLSPGSYRFVGKYKAQLLGPRGLKWRIACTGDTVKLIGESRMIAGKSDAWQDIDFTFTVPPTSCRPQFVSLDLDARMASERLVSGPVWFENMQIMRSDR